jgi:hypothetical protein
VKVNGAKCDGCGKNSDNTYPSIREKPPWHEITMEGGELSRKLTLDACSDACLAIVLRRQIGDAS